MDTSTTASSTTTSGSPSVPVKSVMVASLQASSELGNIKANTEKFTALAEEAAANGAKFLVLPETAITGYLSQDLDTNWVIPGRPNKFPKGLNPDEGYAEHVAGRTTTHFAALAKKLNVYITVPFLEVAAEDEEGVELSLEALEKRGDKEATESGPSVVAASSKAAEEGEGKLDSEETKSKSDNTVIASKKFYNTVCLASPEGKIVAHYRKTSPWPTPERSWASKGKSPAFYDTEYGRVGLAICFDIHSVLALYAPHQIWCLLYPIAWVGNPTDWYRKELPNLLREVNCPHYIAGCNWSTDEPMDKKWEGQGISTHYGPHGELQSSTNSQVGSKIVYSSFWTEKELQRRGHQFDSLDLEKYAQWTNQAGGEAKTWKWD